jgi:hypothetical protein
MIVGTCCMSAGTGIVLSITLLFLTENSVSHLYLVVN